MKWKEGNFSLMMKIELPCPNCVRRQLEADGRGSHGERGHYPMTTGYLRQSSSTAPALERLNWGSVLEAIWKFFDVWWVVNITDTTYYFVQIFLFTMEALDTVNTVESLLAGQESNFVIKYSDITNITFCVLFQKYNFSTTAAIKWNSIFKHACWPGSSSIGI